VDKYRRYTADRLAKARGRSEAILSTMFGGGESHAASVEQGNSTCATIPPHRCRAPHRPQLPQGIFEVPLSLSSLRRRVHPLSPPYISTQRRNGQRCDGIRRRRLWRRAATTTTNDDDDGNGAMGDEVDDDGDGTMGDEDDDDDDDNGDDGDATGDGATSDGNGATGDGATTMTMAMGDDDDDDGDGVTGNEVDNDGNGATMMVDIVWAEGELSWRHNISKDSQHSRL